MKPAMKVIEVGVEIFESILNYSKIDKNCKFLTEIVEYMYSMC